MSEQRITYTATLPIGEVKQVSFDVDDWERNLILRLRQAANAGQLLVCDPNARCWWVTGKMECNKADRELPFRM